MGSAMSFITVGLDENKTYNRAVPPGGFTSNVFHHEERPGQDTNTNTRRIQDQVDNREVRPPRPTENPRQAGPEQFVKARGAAGLAGLGRQNISSRFSAALEQPLLTETASEKMRTPRGLLRLGVPGEGEQSQARVTKPPPGGGSSDFWGNM